MAVNLRLHHTRYRSCASAFRASSNSPPAWEAQGTTKDVSGRSNTHTHTHFDMYTTGMHVDHAVTRLIMRACATAVCPKSSFVLERGVETDGSSSLQITQDREEHSIRNIRRIGHATMQSLRILRLRLGRIRIGHRWCSTLLITSWGMYVCTAHDRN